MSKLLWVRSVFSKNQLPPVFQKTAGKKRSRTAPLGFHSAESAKNRLTATLWVRPPWVKRILKITPQIWRKTLTKIIISQIIIIDKILSQTDPLLTGRRPVVVGRPEGGPTTGGSTLVKLNMRNDDDDDDDE